MRLLAVPRAPVRGAQSSLDCDELFKPLARRQLFLFRRLAAAAQLFCFLHLLLACTHCFFNYFHSKSSVPLYGATLALTRHRRFKEAVPQRRELATRDKLQGR